MESDCRSTLVRQFSEACAIGAARGLLRLPIEHPFERVKTLWQASPESKTLGSMISKIYREQGVSGFYAGGLPNGMRMLIKEIYRWPLMLTLPIAFKTALPENSGSTIPKALSGLVVATVETFILCPIERVKVILMTDKKPILTILKEMKQGPTNTVEVRSQDSFARSLFRGLGVFYARQLVAWTSFLAADAKIRGLIMEYQGRPLTIPELIGAAISVGGVNTVCVMPFDCIKTRVQSLGPSGIPKGMNPALVTMDFTKGRNMAVYVWRTMGIRGFYVGSVVKFLQYCVNSMFTVTLIDYMERRWSRI